MGLLHNLLLVQNFVRIDCPYCNALKYLLFRGITNIFVKHIFINAPTILEIYLDHHLINKPETYISKLRISRHIWIIICPTLIISPVCLCIIANSFNMETYRDRRGKQTDKPFKIMTKSVKHVVHATSLWVCDLVCYPYLSMPMLLYYCSDIHD